MGWDWARTNKLGVVKNALQNRKRGDYNVVIRKHHLDGNILWSIEDVQDAAGKTISSSIVCTVLKPSDDGWGWNRLPEEMHPYYYGVPLDWLKEVPAPKDEPGSENWRRIVRRLAGETTAVGLDMIGEA